jgi:hypothetical protein
MVGDDLSTPYQFIRVAEAMRELWLDDVASMKLSGTAHDVRSAAVGHEVRPRPARVGSW